MARYILKVAGTQDYLYQVYGDRMIETTHKPENAKEYSESMLEQDRLKIAKQVRNEFGTYVEVVRVL